MPTTLRRLRSADLPAFTDTFGPHTLPIGRARPGLRLLTVHGPGDLPARDHTRHVLATADGAACVLGWPPQRDCRMGAAASPNGLGAYWASEF